MNQEIIKVELNELDGQDILTFYFETEEQENISVNLNSQTSQSDFKKVFSNLLQRMISTKIILELEIATGYTKGLYKDVCTEYIKDLNRELKETFGTLQDKVKI